MIISFNCFDISLVHSTVECTRLIETIEAARQTVESAAASLSCYKVYTIGRRSFNNIASPGPYGCTQLCVLLVVSDVFRLNENPIHASSEQLQPSSEPDGLTVVSRGAGGDGGVGIRVRRRGRARGSMMSEQDQEVEEQASAAHPTDEESRTVSSVRRCGTPGSGLVAPSLMVTRSCVCLSARTCAGSAAASRAPPRSATGAGVRCTLVSTLTNTVQYTLTPLFSALYCILFTRTRYKPLNAEHTRTHACLHGTQRFHSWILVCPCSDTLRNTVGRGKRPKKHQASERLADARVHH